MLAYTLKVKKLVLITATFLLIIVNSKKVTLSSQLSKTHKTDYRALASIIYSLLGPVQKKISLSPYRVK